MKNKKSISKIKNTFLRRSLVITAIPFVIVIMVICGFVECLGYVYRSLLEFIDDNEHHIEELAVSIKAAWDGK
jgi:ABC-type Fe3+ transport system permease subunit